MHDPVFACDNFYERLDHRKIPRVRFALLFHLRILRPYVCVIQIRIVGGTEMATILAKLPSLYSLTLYKTKFFSQINFDVDFDNTNSDQIHSIYIFLYHLIYKTNFVQATKRLLDILIKVHK